MRLLAILFTVSLLFPTVSSSNTIHVPADCATIQEGLDASGPYDTVKVAAGVYPEHLTMPPNRLLWGEAGAALTAIDGSGTDRVLVIPLAAGSVVRGFTIRNGYAPDAGGGVYTTPSFPFTFRLEDCILCDNVSGGDGGAVWISGDVTEIVNCVFERNQALNGSGGAIYRIPVEGVTAMVNEVILTGCVLRDNYASLDGGAAWIKKAVSSISDNEFIGNEAGRLAGGLCLTFGWLSVEDNVFESNHALEGGAIFVRDTYNSNPMQGNVFRENEAVEDGGAISLTFCHVDLTNNVLVDNIAGTNGGGVHATGTTHNPPEVRFNTVVGNSAGGWGGGLCIGWLPEALVCDYNIVVGNNGYGIAKAQDPGVWLIIGCNDVWNNEPADYYDIGPAATDISLDPLFCDEGSGDFSLAVDSPCLDVPECGLIGALGQGCGTSTEVDEAATKTSTWGVVKSIFEVPGER